VIDLKWKIKPLFMTSNSTAKHIITSWTARKKCNSDSTSGEEKVWLFYKTCLIELSASRVIAIGERTNHTNTHKIGNTLNRNISSDSLSTIVKEFELKARNATGD